MPSLGDFPAGTVVHGKFTTVRPSTGEPFTLAGTPALSVYKDNSTTQSTTGVTLTADFDSLTGLNHFSVNCAADATFYSNGSIFDVIITTGTVDGVSAVGQVVSSFTIQANYSSGGGGGGGDPWATALPGAYTAGQAGYILGTNLDAAVSTRATQTSVNTIDDFLDTEIAAIKAVTDLLPLPMRTGTAQGGASSSITLDAGASAVDNYYRYAMIYITGGTGAGQAKMVFAYTGATKVATMNTAWITAPDATSTFAILPFSLAPVDVLRWNGSNLVTPTTNGVPVVDVTHWLGTGVSASTAGIPNVNTHRLGNSQGAATGLGGLYGAATINLGAVPSADSGTTTTLTDASLAQSDVDYWKGMTINFQSGTLAGLSRTITAFDPTTDTLTFTPATPVAVSTHAYIILPAATDLSPKLDTIDDFLDTEVAAIKTKTDQLTFSAGGNLDANVEEWLGTAVTATTAGAPDVNAFRINNSGTAASNLQRTFSGASGGLAADSGTTTTLTDAALTQSDVDYWKGQTIVFSSGTLNGIARSITAFDPATDTITFSPATPVAVSTHSYTIIPFSFADESANIGAIKAKTDQLTFGTANRVDAQVYGMQADTVTASAIAAGAIDNDALADDTGLKPIRSNTAQGGGASTITLDTGASATDDFYNGNWIYITGGTGVGQMLRVIDYVGATKVATMVASWKVNPDATSTFAIIPQSIISANILQWNGSYVATPTVAGVPEVDVTHWLGTGVSAGTAGTPNVDVNRINNQSGPAGVLARVFSTAGTPTADSGTTTTLVDAALTQTNSDHWVGQTLIISSGTMAGMTRRITAFNPATDTLTFSPALPSAITTESYVIAPFSFGDDSVEIAAVTSAIAGLNDLSAAQVNAEVVDALNTDTYAEPGQESPGATISLAKKIGYLYKAFRNKVTQTSSTFSLFADNTTTVDQKATVSDDGTTFTRGEITTGP